VHSYRLPLPCTRSRCVVAKQPDPQRKRLGIALSPFYSADYDAGPTISIYAFPKSLEMSFHVEGGSQSLYRSC
jgi:hypothetical protein